MSLLKPTSWNKSLAGLIISVLCFAIFTSVNYWIFKHKNEGFLNKYGNYPDFFILHETPAIVGFKKAGAGQLQCIISPKVSNSWTIKLPDATKYESRNPNPVISLVAGNNSYELTPENKDKLPLKLDITYVSSETYREKGNSTGDNYYISKSNYPIFKHKKYGIYDFAFSEDNYRKEEIAEAKKIIYEDIGVLENESTKSKILKISKYLYDKIDQHAGIPSDSIKYLSPLEQYRRITSGKDGAWCHNYAVIYTFFMTAAGIMTRLVSLEGEIDQVKIAGHIFAENFVKEKNKWAFSDMNSGIFLAEDVNGNPYDTIELLSLNDSDALEKVSFICYDNGSPKKCALASKTFTSIENMRLKPNVEIVYLLKSYRDTYIT